MNPSALTLHAPAKLNLALHLLGTRPDGYHELRTVLQAIALHDVLECAPQDGGFTLVCDRADVPVDRSNLIWRAAEALWRALGRDGTPSGAVVRLQKRIPLQAGLGGGSADAAAALVGLGRLWGGSLPPLQLEQVAATLGADVPFFLSGGTALGLGRGDEIYPLTDLPRQWVVLLVPSFGVATREAYAWYDVWAAGPGAAAGPAVVAQQMPGDWPARAAQMRNDLEAPVAHRHPEIARMTAALREAGASAAAMSGSGSTVFGLFSGRSEARQAVARLAGQGWRTLLTRTLSRPEYARRTRPRPMREGAAGAPILPGSAGLDYT